MIQVMMQVVHVVMLQVVCGDEGEDMYRTSAEQRQACGSHDAW